MSDASMLGGVPTIHQMDEARRVRSITVLQHEGVPFIDWLPVVVQQVEAYVQPAQLIVERLVAMWAVCVYSEARQSGQTWDESQKYLTWADNALGNGLAQTLTPQESAYLACKEPDRRDIAKFGWRYECCYVLMWALGLIDVLGRPESLCDVSAMSAMLWPIKNVDTLLTLSKPRPDDAILDAADLVLRYDWACVDARINGRGNPAGLDGEVSAEWHYAFDWLVGANGDVGWDDISPNT